MAVRATCTNCGKSVKGGDDWTGREAKCPGCGAAILFGAAPPPPPPIPPSMPDLVADLVDEYEGQADEIPPPAMVNMPELPKLRMGSRPAYNTSIGAVACMLLAILVAGGGMLVMANAQSAIHEIEAGVAFIVASVLFASAIFLSIDKTIRDISYYHADLAREQSAYEQAALAEIKAELRWFRSVKEKEIVRAKATRRSSVPEPTD